MREIIAMVTTVFTDVTAIAPELGVFFLLSSLLFFSFLRKMKGNSAFLDLYIVSRPWPFLRNDATLPRSLRMVKAAFISILIWAPLTLVLWTVSLFITAGQDSSRGGFILPVSTFCIGAAGLLGGSGVQSLLWKRFRISGLTLGLVSAGGLCYLSFQLGVVFMDEDIHFWAISAVFLSANGLTFVVLLFVVSPGGTSINTVIGTLPSDSSDGLSQSQVFTYFTLPQSSSLYSFSAVSGGFQALLGARVWSLWRILAVVCLYTVALAVLAVYSGLVWGLTEYGALGILTSVNVVVTDVLVGLWVFESKDKETMTPTVISIGCRFFLMSNA